MAPAQPPAPSYMPVSPPSRVSPPSSITSNDEPIAGAGGGLQRAVSLFRTPSVSRDDHEEQLPAFTDVALPEEMVPENMAHTGPTPRPPPQSQSPPPPHAFSAPSSPPPSLHNGRPRPPPLHASRNPPPPVPALPTNSDPPPAFVPSNSHYAIPEKTDPYAHIHLENTRVMSKPVSIYASANKAYAPPTIKFDLETAYGRRASPGPPNQNGASFYR